MSQDGSDCEDFSSDPRLPCHAESENGRGQTFGSGSIGGFGEDTVGKFESMRHGHEPHLVHRSIRMRMRPDKPFNHSTSESTSFDLQRWKTTRQPEAHASTLSVQPIEVDPVEDMYIDMGISHHSNMPRTGSDASMTLSDFSNYLPSQSYTHEPMDVVVTSSSDNGSDFRFASPKDDFYGWDAELDRRNITIPCPMESCSDDCETVALSFRRANGARHNLLQRVFKVGSAAPLKYESSL